MASDLYSKKCCSDLSNTTFLIKLPSSLTLVLSLMMFPGNKSSFNKFSLTFVRVLLYGLF